MQNQIYPQYPQYPQMQPYQPQQPARTVWTDLDAERSTMTEQEYAFVMQDNDYIKADTELQNAFNTFLQVKFRDEFLNSDSRNLTDKKLLALKMSRKEYQRQNDGILNDPEIMALIEKKRGAKSGN